MSARKSLLLTLLCAVVLAGIIIAFNYTVDPLCYYCKTVDVDRSTLNRFYQVAQVIARNPDAEQVILGSSRGETTSPFWVQQMSGMKTLNLSSEGSEFIAKKAFLAMAQEKIHLKRVIWYADYFELVPGNADAKIRNTQVFFKYAGNLLQAQGASARLRELQQLIDHNTIEASFAALKKSQAADLGQGRGGQFDYTACARPDYAGTETTEHMLTKVDVFFESYVHGVIASPQDPAMWIAFRELLESLKQQHVSVDIIIPPYQPLFEERLQKEFPLIYEAHLSWIQKLQELAGSGVQIHNYFEGLPHGNSTTQFWNDGVHFTCKGVIEMLTPILQPAKN